MDARTSAALGDVQIASVGALLADPARCRILMALHDGRALSASVLADEAGVSRSTASGHLGRLTDDGLLRVESHGRHRYYRLSGHQVGELLERIMELAPARPVRSLREGTRAAQLRAARTCYDHLAGRLGVALMGAFLDRRWLVGGDGTFDVDHADRDRLSAPGHDLDYELTPAGFAFLDRFEVHLPPHRRTIRYCVDWTEQRHHLAGGLGRGLLDRLTGLDWIRATGGGRAVQVTAEGRDGLRDTFGIEADER
jgi:DNA-binding transcriptional ArsR family regulator